MRICVRNFKGIEHFEFDTKSSDIMVLTGENSGGKTSILQSILLMTQSVNEGKDTTPIVCDGSIIQLGNPRALINSNAKGEDKFINYTFSDNMDRVINASNRSLLARNSFFRTIIRRESVRTSTLATKSILSFLAKGNYTVNLILKESGGRLNISELSYEIEIPGINNRAIIKYVYDRRLPDNSIKYSVFTNHKIFLNIFSYRKQDIKDLSYIEHIQNGFVNAHSDLERIKFQRMIPRSASKYGDTGFRLSHTDRNEDNNLDYYQISVDYTLVEFIQNEINAYYDSITYIGPLRQRPESIYIKKGDILDAIGTYGENAVELLARNADKNIYCPQLKDNKIIYTKMTLKSAVNYWMCSVFGLAKSIDVKSHLYDEVYKIIVKNRNNNPISVNNVGFGISQIMPIVVHGLICDENKTIILEQPEIHLHPRIQSILFDYIYAISKNKKVIVETHSDHFINRLRRRVIEDDTDLLGNRIDLIFAENGQFDRITIDNNGFFNKWPEGFFDQDDIELQLLLTARVKKQRRQQNE